MSLTTEEKVTKIQRKFLQAKKRAARSLLSKFLGDWVIQELTATSSLDVNSLAKYIATAKLDADVRSTLEDFLAAVNANANQAK